MSLNSVSTYPDAVYLAFGCEADACAAAAYLNGRRGLEAYYLDRCLTLGFMRDADWPDVSSTAAASATAITTPPKSTSVSSSSAAKSTFDGDECGEYDSGGGRKRFKSNVECELLVANRQLK